MNIILNQKPKLGFYFHIPFCPHICPYCDFTKTSKFLKKDTYNYFIYLNKQLEYFINYELKVDKNKKDNVTIYFGGGTPGLFEGNMYLSLIEKIKEYFFVDEITIETNPLTNNKRNFKKYIDVGFNRITLGAQSLCLNTLNKLGRKHTPVDILNSLFWARHSGFNNIQVDLIYGLKKEIRNVSILDEIELLYEHGATGISAYALMIEKRTHFAKLDYDDEFNTEKEYLEIVTKCREIGFIQKETSNFSFYETQHNNLYWYGYPYIGIGTGAHGLLPPTKEFPYGRRYRIGPESFLTYDLGNDALKYSKKDEIEKNFNIHYENPRNKEEYLQEMFFTLLRTPMGIPIEWLKKHIDIELFMSKLKLNQKLVRAFDENKLFFREDSIHISDKEKIRGDSWVVEFVSLL